MNNQADIDFIKDVTRWPTDFICVQRYPVNDPHNPSECGWIHSEVGLSTVLKRNLADNKLIGTIEYDSVEALVADGWCVD